jgi:flagellar biosynthesis protein FlhB
MTESMQDFVVRKLQEAKAVAWPQIAAECDIPLRTLEKVARRVYKSHRLSTIEPLAEHLGYFDQFQRRRKSN